MRLKKRKQFYLMPKAAANVLDVCVKINGIWMALESVNHLYLFDTPQYQGDEMPKFFHFDGFNKRLTIHPKPKKDYYASVRFLRLDKI